MKRVEIFYCPVCNGYDERAASLAAELNERTPHEAEAVSGEKSQFDVVADGNLIFSKQREGLWPEAEEIIRALGADSAT
jgi:selT/selW/selH-like putative selenoprotein